MRTHMRHELTRKEIMILVHCFGIDLTVKCNRTLTTLHMDRIKRINLLFDFISNFFLFRDSDVDLTL